MAPDPDRLITYSSRGKTVQYVALDLAAHAGLRYNFAVSFAQTDPICRTYVTKFSVRAYLSQSHGKAAEAKGPQLRHRIGAVVLFRK